MLRWFGVGVVLGSTNIHSAPIFRRVRIIAPDDWFGHLWSSPLITKFWFLSRVLILSNYSLSLLVLRVCLVSHTDMCFGKHKHIFCTPSSCLIFKQWKYFFESSIIFHPRKQFDNTMTYTRLPTLWITGCPNENREEECTHNRGKVLHSADAWFPHQQEDRWRCCNPSQ